VRAVAGLEELLGREDVDAVTDNVAERTAWDQAIAAARAGKARAFGEAVWI